jgi:hypothetical protein
MIERRNAGQSEQLAFNEHQPQRGHDCHIVYALDRFAF